MHVCSDTANIEHAFHSYQVLCPRRADADCTLRDTWYVKSHFLEFCKISSSLQTTTVRIALSSSARMSPTFHLRSFFPNSTPPAAPHSQLLWLSRSDNWNATLEEISILMQSSRSLTRRILSDMKTHRQLQRCKQAIRISS